MAEKPHEKKEAKRASGSAGDLSGEMAQSDVNQTGNSQVSSDALNGQKEESAIKMKSSKLNQKSPQSLSSKQDSKATSHSKILSTSQRTKINAKN